MMNGKVIDVYLDGSVSQLALWRSQFASVIKKDGIDGLVARLKEQAQKMAS
jgi:ABC-type transporter MlaC component